MMFFGFYFYIWIPFCPFLGFVCYQLRLIFILAYDLQGVLFLFYVCCFFYFVFLFLLLYLLSYIPQVLYHVLGSVPAYQASIAPALNELCLGLQPNEVAPVCPVFM